MKTTLAAMVMGLSAGLMFSATSSENGGDSSASSNSAPPAAEGHSSGGGHVTSGSEGSGSTGSSVAHSGSGSTGVSRPAAPGSYASSRGSVRPGVSQSRIPSRSGMSPLRPVEGGGQPRISRKTTVLHQGEGTKGNILRTRDGKPHEGNWARNNPSNRSRFDRQTESKLRNWQGPRSGYIEACRRQNDHHHHHHNHEWWHHHCPAIVLVDWGYWAWNDGWWYPAWGYDANYSDYEYDGPIYSFDGSLPDEVIANAQSALRDLGYYSYEVDGIFGPLTQEALARFQRDQGLTVTGAIDPATVAALGLTG